VSFRDVHTPLDPDDQQDRDAGEQRQEGHRVGRKRGAARSVQVGWPIEHGDKTADAEEAGNGPVADDVGQDLARSKSNENAHAESDRTGDQRATNEPRTEEGGGRSKSFSAGRARAWLLVLVGLVLNPVAILLTTVHGNFNLIVGLMVLFFIWAITRWQRHGHPEDWLLACLFLGVAILAKTTPLVQRWW
jgi:hypothetical protein